MKKNWPVPKYWQDFEDMCHRLYVAELKPRQHFKYGRAGQAQYGVDIAVRLRDGQWIGIQCKLKTEILGSKLSEQELLDEYNKSVIFPFMLDDFYIATTCVRDTAVQNLAQRISTSWQKSHAVEVKFWDDIEELLEKHESVARLFYPNFFISPSEFDFVTDDYGDLTIAFGRNGGSTRLANFFAHNNFKSLAGEQFNSLATIVSELVDNALDPVKGNAERVVISIVGQILSVRDDGNAFHIIDSEILLSPKMRGVNAIRRKLIESAGQLKHSYLVANEQISRFQENRFEISPTKRIPVDLCSAPGPATLLLNRFEAAMFVKNLVIPDDCPGFTLRLYSTDFMNESAASQIVEDLLTRLGERPLRIKIGEDCKQFLDALQREANRFPNVQIDNI